jgi:hypothetical protein
MKNLPEIEGATLLTVEEAKELSKNISLAERNWWLRSPGGFDDWAAFVFGDDGHVDDDGYFVYEEFGVRPALRISNLESSDLQVGDKFIFGGQSWTIISDDKALCDDVMGESVFCRDLCAKDANVYEASDVKKFVDDWYANAKNYTNELGISHPKEEKSRTREITIRVELYDDTPISDFEQAMMDGGIEGIDCGYEIMDNGFVKDEYDREL